MNRSRRTAIALFLAVAAVTAAMPIAVSPAVPPAAPPDANSHDVINNVLPTAGAFGDSSDSGIRYSPVTGKPLQASTTLPIVQTSNATSRLVLPDGEQQTARFETVRIDVGGAMAIDNAELHGEYHDIRLSQSYAAANGTVEQRAVVNRTVDQLEAQIADLVQREREALRAYNTGRLSTSGYLRELAAIDAAARSLELTLEEVVRYDRAAGMPVPATRVAQLKTQLVPLSGPVRSAVADAMLGSDTNSLRVYVETSTSGVVLSMVEHDGFTTRYLREAYHGDSFDRHWTDNPITHNEFENRFSDLYPWVWSANSQVDTVLTSEPYHFRAGVYGMAVNHPQGTESNRDLLTYYDAGTESIFYEVQRLNPTTIPTRRLDNGSDEGLHLQLRTVYDGGPMEVIVTNTTTGDTVDASVTVSGSQVGTTGGDRLWTIAPRGNFAVTATTDGRNVTVGVSNSTINATNP